MKWESPDIIPDLFNFFVQINQNRPSETAQKSIFYFFSIMYIKLENSLEKRAFMLEIVP